MLSIAIFCNHVLCKSNNGSDIHTFSWRDFNQKAVDTSRRFSMLCGIARVVCSITFITDVLPTNYIYREMISDAQWITAQLAVYTYLAGVFRTLPRMAFFQPSENNTSICVPTMSLIKSLFWTMSLTLIIVAHGSSILSGYFRMKENKFLLDVFTTTRLVTYGISCILLVIGYGIYGRLLIDLTIQSFDLVQGQGGIAEACQETHITDVFRNEDGMEGRNIHRIYILSQEGEKGEVETRNDRFKYHIRKMKIFNYSAIMTFVFWSLTSFVLAFWHDTIWSTIVLSKIQAFLANINTNLIFLVVLIGILQSELIHHKCQNSLDVTKAVVSSESSAFDYSETIP
ncbi:9633_t:CDS:2 [Funneliformis mosseae]|uniref:9633_t:CDS:1 n=1 Tax=Funneliformis mosseae TaxID=27381 RepID=A0A9N9AXW5_FUNMO|nr:9633_t:CDS:2 [Funneliformis mosseae]